MTLKQKFFDVYTRYYKKSNELDKMVEITDNHAIEFTEWKDHNFLMYRDRSYYAITSSDYFDKTKYIAKEKPTKYYTIKELLAIFKKEKGL
jgi:hypothetical protein